MPELPEVEVTRRGIAPVLLGARVLQLRIGKPLRWPLGVEPARLAGRVAGAVQRRGKYLWLPLAPPPTGMAPAVAERVAAFGEPAAAAVEGGGLLLHLGMSGSLAWLHGEAARAAPGPHDHFDLVTDRGTLRLTDPRRFGAVVWSNAIDADPAATLLARLGPEPAAPALTPAAFHAALQRRSAPIKQVLLAGDAVVGAGNIYACEALHAAGIHPALPADRISRPRAARLLAAVQATLARAVEAGGSTLRDYTNAHGAAGSYQSDAAVYGRAGQPCRRCGTPVRRTLQGQRSTFFCPGCQRR